MRAAVATLPRARASPALARLAPTRRSLAAGLGLVAIAAGVYVAARQSSAFSVSRVEVAGAPTEIQAQVRHAVAPLVGTSLLALDGAALERRVEALPAVRAAVYDRAFPHTLRIHVLPEVPVAVLHRGKETWLVSARGRVISRIPNLTFGTLARVWISFTAVIVNDQLGQTRQESDQVEAAPIKPFANLLLGDRVPSFLNSGPHSSNMKLDTAQPYVPDSDLQSGRQCGTQKRRDGVAT